MQAFCCEVVRALMKLGMAIAASRPMMATTIMISTRVKPDFSDVFLFICFFLLQCERCNRRVIIISFLFTYCLLQLRMHPPMGTVLPTTSPNTEFFPGPVLESFRITAELIKRCAWEGMTMFCHPPVPISHSPLFSRIPSLSYPIPTGHGISGQVG